MGDLARQAVRGMLITGAGTFAARLVSYAGSYYLMRRIDVPTFGVVAYASSLVVLAASFAEWGLSRAAVHRQERVDETFATFFVLRVGMVALVLGLALPAALALRPQMAAGVRVDVLLVLAAATLANATCDVQVARHTRALRLGRLVPIETAGILAATGAAVILAASGLGVWAIVVNLAGPTVVRLVGLQWVRVEPPRLAFHVDDARWLLRFGFPLWIGSLATAWLFQYNNVVVGSLLGKEALGYYSQATNLALIPWALVGAALARVSFPLYARLQGDRAQLSEAFRLASGTTLRLAAPMSVGLAIALPDALVVLGLSKWLPAVSVVRWLLLYALVRPLMDDAGGLLTAIGRPRVAVQMLVGQAVALLVICPPATWLWDAEGAAASIGLVAAAGLAFWYAHSLPKFVDIAYRRMLLWPLLSVATAGAIGLLIEACAKLSVGWAAGAAKLAAVALVYAAVLFALDGRQTLADLRRGYRAALGSEAGK